MDEIMVVIQTHDIVGSLIGILTGLFVKPKLSNLICGSYRQYVGLFYGFDMGRFDAWFRQMGIQLMGFVFNMVRTSIICLLIKLVVPLRMFEEDMQINDEAAHGEETCAIWDYGGRRHERSSYYSDEGLQCPIDEALEKDGSMHCNCVKT